MGTSYAIFASVIIPSVALVVNNNIIGLAFGIIIAGMNVFLFICPIVVSKLYQITDSFDYVSIFYIKL